MTVKARSILFLLIPFFILVIAVEGIAQGVQTPNTQEITGSVAAFTMTTITVNAEVIDIAQAQITGTIMLGATVRVHVTVALDGTVVATEVVVVPPGFHIPSTQEVNGEGEDINATPEATDDHGQDFNATPEATDDHGGANQSEDGNH